MVLKYGYDFGVVFLVIMLSTSHGGSISGACSSRKPFLNDVINLVCVMEDEPEFDFGFMSLTENIRHENAQLRFHLMKYLMHEYNPDSTSQPELKIFSVMKEALQVLEKHCPEPFIDNGFLHLVFEAVVFLSSKSGSTSKLDDIGKREHRLLTNVLRKCNDNPAKFIIKINGSSCGSYSKRIPIIDGVSYKPEEKSWKWGKFDLVMETAWSAVEFVLGYCSGEYAGDLTFQDLFVKGMEALFANKMQEYWRYPPKWVQLIDVGLGLRNSNLTMGNIDSCIQASRKFSPFKERLGRPFEKY